MANRQFIQRESMEIVLCEWDPRKGSWRCSSTPGSPYNRRVDTLSKLVSGMKAEGFEELTPSLRKAKRFAKPESDYRRLPIIDSKSAEMSLAVPMKASPPPKPTKTHLPE